MNNTKPVISEEAADFPSPTRATKRKRQKSSRQQQPMPMGSEIRNLPAKLIVTPEILKHNVCRVCATYYESGLDLVPLYTSYLGEGPKLALIMNTMLPIKVRKQDGLSQYSCRMCANQLMAWRKLREGVVEAQKILMNQTTQLIRDVNYGVNDRDDVDVEAARASAETRSSPAKRARKRRGCASCGRVLSDAANLARHARCVHGAPAARPHACRECGRAFTRAEHLRSHMRLHAAPEAAPALLCESCGATCASPAALRSHRRLHREATLHACACGARFRRAGALRAHASVHTGARPYACACGRAFRLRAQLTAHERRHVANDVPDSYS